MLKIIAKQFRKPSGMLGHLISSFMNIYNNQIYKDIFDLLEVKVEDKLLEIGYGSGLGIAELNKKLPGIKIDGIDFSKLMYEKASARNKKAIEKNDVYLMYGDITKNELESTYDKVFAVNVVYFWEDPKQVFEKLYSLLNEGGILVLFVKSVEQLEKHKFTKNEAFNKHSIEMLKNALLQVGFETDVISFNKGLDHGNFLVARR